MKVLRKCFSYLQKQYCPICHAHLTLSFSKSTVNNDTTILIETM